MWRFPLPILAAAALAASCSVSNTPDEELLSDLGEEILPAGAEIVGTTEGACPQFAGNPSCARIFFVSQGSEDARAGPCLEQPDRDCADELQLIEDTP